jgi:hypothetical protein
MALPTSRAEFKEYCLRKLGKPVIEINVDDDQVEDRIDEALSYYQDFHFDGTERTFLKHQVTQTDRDRGYIEIAENIIGAVRVFPLSSNVASTGMFNVQYQFVLNHLHELTDYNMVHYFLSMQHLQFMEEMLVGEQPIRYNRHQNRLYIDTDWNEIEIGNYIVAEVYQVLDPETYTDVWKDRWLLNYATAKIQYQWASNLSKFSQVQLPGGVTFNADVIMTEAKEQIQKLEEDMANSYSLPAYDMIG